MSVPGPQPLDAIVRELRAAHPGWIIIWGVLTGRFEALACCFRSTNVWEFGQTPDALPERIRLAERTHPPHYPPTWAMFQVPPSRRQYRIREDSNDHPNDYPRPSAG